jgi:hypothetical protein
MADELLEAWAAQVHALPPRKRKNWRPPQGPRDADGSLSVVRVAPGPGIHFEQRLSARAAALRGVPAGSWLPILSVTERRTLAEELRGANVATSELMVARPEGGAVDLQADFLPDALASMAAAHTGNHRPHAHTVRVPTAPGQPVRG